MKYRKYRYFVGDFETTVYDGQEDTLVWASALVEMGTEDVKILHSIDETYSYLKELNTDVVVYYHNLKFDGSFWLYYLLHDLHYKTAAELISEEPFICTWLKDKEMPSKSVKYMISKMGMWYRIVIKIGKHIIELRDSLKLLPFSVKQIGNSFGTKHKKLDMEYTGYRFPDCEITEEEQKYIANDVLVVKEALEIMFNDGHTGLTIGGCCLKEYKNLFHNTRIPLPTNDYDEIFPDLYAVPIDESYDAPSAGEYIRKSYKGGWCYCVKGKEKRIHRNGVTLDVNSLYPSMMHSMSGNVYPFGQPHFWKGTNFPSEISTPNTYYFIRIMVRFHIKPNYLPFIQIKRNILYKATEMLETSDINGSPHLVELTLTKTDWLLFKEHYEIDELYIMDGCWFRAVSGLFDDYIDKYAEIKKTSKGAKRQEAKLFLNNLYGKMASSPDSSFKVADVLNDQDGLVFRMVAESDKKPGYIPIGSAITSYSRNFTIRAAQKNYYGKNKEGFIYADTDSIHCSLPIEKIRGVNLHPVNFCCWDLEASWDYGWFVRQKTYIEHIVKEENEDCKPYFNVKCAGMPEKCKKLFLQSVEGTADINEEYNEQELKFLFNPDGTPIRRTVEDFQEGFSVPGKLMPVQIKGGTLLKETTFCLR